MKLWLDDIRDPRHNGCIGWEWVKTADDAIRELASGRVTHVSLDHDLGIEATLGQPPKEKTGYDVVLWLEANPQFWPKVVMVHSMNPVGKKRMLEVISRRHCDQGSNSRDH